jgi:lysophospholipase
MRLGHVEWSRDIPWRNLAAMVAPMLDIDTGRYPGWFTRLITTAYNLRRPSKRYVFGVAHHPPMTLPFEKNLVTSDRSRWERMQALMRAQPFLRVYGPTFGWLGAALRSIRQVKRRGFPEEIVTPIPDRSGGRRPRRPKSKAPNTSS